MTDYEGQQLKTSMSVSFVTLTWYRRTGTLLMYPTSAVSVGSFPVQPIARTESRLIDMATYTDGWGWGRCDHTTNQNGQRVSDSPIIINNLLIYNITTIQKYIDRWKDTIGLHTVHKIQIDRFYIGLLHNLGF